jgi:hypothetical protein
MSVIVALFLTTSLELPDSDTPSTKRKITLFPYIGLHSHQPSSQAKLHNEDVAKIGNNPETSKFYAEKVIFSIFKM